VNSERDIVKEYFDMPKKFGWKYELMDEKIYAFPWEMVIVYEHNLTNPKEIHSEYHLTDIDTQDMDSYVSAWLSAFNNSVDFYKWDEEDIESRAKKIFNLSTAGLEDNRALASMICKKENIIIGAATITKTDFVGNPLLEGLFVIPEYQRKGLATALFSNACIWLTSNGLDRLISYCHIANEIGNDWHKKMGFKELPDLQLAKMRWHYFSLELDRLSRLNQLAAGKREELSNIVKRLDEEIQNLKYIEETEGYDAVFPLNGV
jgi:RimJ/RimL family protein N-acetyltransferase